MITTRAPDGAKNISLISIQHTRVLAAMVDLHLSPASDQFRFWLWPLLHKVLQSILYIAQYTWNALHTAYYTLNMCNYTPSSISWRRKTIDCPSSLSLLHPQQPPLFHRRSVTSQQSSRHRDIKYCWYVPAPPHQQHHWFDVEMLSRKEGGASSELAELVNLVREGELLEQKWSARNAMQRWKYNEMQNLKLHLCCQSYQALPLQPTWAKLIHVGSELEAT